MGNTCGTDAYQSIVGKYGQMFSQMAMAQQAKSTITQYFNQNKNQTQSFFNNYQTETFQQMDQGMNAFQNQFTGIEQTLASKIPGGLQSFVPNGQSFQQVMGYTNVVNQVSALKGNTESQIQRQLAQATADMSNMQSMTLAKINQSRPMIPQFDSLSPSLQKSLIQRAMEQYSPQIQRNNKDITDQISPILAGNMANYKSQLTSLNPLGQMSGLIGNYQSGFGSQLQGLIPKNVLGGFDLGSVLGEFNLGGLGLGSLGSLGNMAGMAGGLTNGLGGIGNSFGGMANNVSNGIGGISNGLATGINNGLGGMNNNLQNIGQVAQGGMNSFSNTVTNTSHNMAEGMNRIF